MVSPPQPLGGEAFELASAGELRHCLRDLLAVHALPAVLSGKPPVELVQLLASTLEHLLGLDACYVHAPLGRDVPAATALRVQGAILPDTTSWSGFLRTDGAGLASETVVSSEATPIGTLQMVRVTISYAGQAGLMFLGSRDGSFPDPQTAVVIRAAASLAGNALATATALRDRDEALRAKDEFLAMLGHELRNPLAPITSILAVLRIRNGGTLSAEHQIIERQVKHLTGLVDDLLDIAKVARGKVEIHPVELDTFTLVAQAIEMSRPLIEQRQHELTIAVPATGLHVRADPRRMAQVLSNLLINAAKYTPEGGRIYLWARGDGPDVLIGVRDNGIGIDSELLPHVFEMFYQVQGARDRSGLGLGLALVKALVSLHGGTVAAASAGPGLGSEFIVRLPLVTSHGSAARGPAVTSDVSASAMRPERILLVDDNKDAASTLAELLRLAGHEALVAHDAAEALHVCERFGPSVAILDIGLPGISGYELAGLVRQQMGVNCPRLIALSGFSQQADIALSLEAGFETHLAKPVEPDRLLSVIASGASAVDPPYRVH